MNTYTIRKAYHWTDDKDIEIESTNLIFIEADNHHGLQCSNVSKQVHDQILNKCSQIAKIIKEIDELNNPT